MTSHDGYFKAISINWRASTKEVSYFIHILTYYLRSKWQETSLDFGTVVWRHNRIDVGTRLKTIISVKEKDYILQTFCNVIGRLSAFFKLYCSDVANSLWHTEFVLKITRVKERWKFTQSSWFCRLVCFQLFKFSQLIRVSRIIYTCFGTTLLLVI